MLLLEIDNELSSKIHTYLYKECWKSLPLDFVDVKFEHYKFDLLLNMDRRFQ